MRGLIWGVDSLLAVSLALAGCGVDANPITPDAGATASCNPLSGVACLFPWPSSAYLDEDTTTPTGYRVAIPTEAMPANENGVVIDPAQFARLDGFSPSGAMIVGFATGISPAGLPGPSDIAASLAADSPIVLLDMASGQRVPFFAEVDQNAEDVADRVLLIRPQVRLAGGTRHLVALRKSLLAADGSPLPVAPAFQAMVDGASFDHPLMAKLAPGYPAIFAALGAEGIDESDLVLAWDFVTASDQTLQADMLSMRDQALAWFETAANLSFQAEEQPMGNPALVHSFLTGTVAAPSFLDDDAEEQLSKLARDAAGAPLLTETRAANFAAIIPRCVEDPALRPAPVIIFGHGLFGSGEDSLDSGLVQEVAETQCIVFVAGDWIGLTQHNFASALLAVNDLNRGEALVDKLGQGVIDFMALTRTVKRVMKDAPEFQIDGEPVIDDTRVYYYGASLGGIMGNIYMAYEPEIERGGLGVPGGAWNLLFERSFAWMTLGPVLRGAYDAPLDLELVIAFLGMGMEKFDPITTAHRVIADPMPGVPEKQLFMYQAVGDCLVTNLSTEMVARTMGIPVTGPSLYVPFGFEEETGDASSGLTIYDEHPTPLPPTGNTPPSEDNGTHSGVNDRPAVQRQLGNFLKEGVLRHECFVAEAPAPCDCSTGACD